MDSAGGGLALVVAMIAIANVIGAVIWHLRRERQITRDWEENHRGERRYGLDEDPLYENPSDCPACIRGVLSPHHLHDAAYMEGYERERTGGPGEGRSR